MNAPSSLSPELRLLVERWQLPPARIADVRELIRSQEEGGTAWCLPPTSPADPAAWGRAAGLPRSSPASPLVLRRVGSETYLQSWRLDAAEGEIAATLLARAAQPPLLDPGETEDHLRLLAGEGLNREQEAAVAAGLRRHLTLITGGPGTGKTHTLARLLALLLVGAHGPRPVLRLAAPTGKAADRMRDAIQAAAAKLGPTFAPFQANLGQLGAEASTLHHLLGYNPAQGRCRHHAGNPLRADALIIDECSMVDTWMWRALLATLPITSRLILLGDPHQLESVDAGDVLGSLVRPGPDGQASPLAAHHVELHESRRFRDRQVLGQLAQAVVGRRADAAVALLESQRPTPPVTSAPPGGLLWLGPRPGRPTWDALPRPVQEALHGVAWAPTPEQALAALDRVRVLTAHRDGAWGVAGLNRALREHFRGSHPAGGSPNEPVIINRNDASTGLRNGSVGVLIALAAGVRAYFPGPTAGAPPRSFSIAELPDHEPAWAMTIHRAQGSEFDHVVVVLPAVESRLSTGELVYTALTRAKACVHVWGESAELRHAVRERPGRSTLLGARLRAAAGWPA